MAKKKSNHRVPAVKKARPIKMPLPRPVGERHKKPVLNMKGMANKQTLDKYRHKLRVAAKEGKVPYSREYHFGTKNKRDRRRVTILLNKCMREIGKKYVHHVDMKAPTGCPAAPASFTPSSFNIYFGRNLKKDTATGAIERTAYATGSGFGSIGLDPRTMKLFHMFPELDEMAKLMTDLMNKDPDFEQQMGGRSFDVVSVKGYWDGKETNWHQDIQLKADGTPEESNSQIPGTPVAIVTYGDPKNLWFGIRHHPPFGVKVPIKDTVLRLQQLHGSVSVLDGRDEKLRSDGTTVIHKSDRKYQKPNGVTFSLLFRCSAASVWVHPTEHTLINPPPMGPDRQAKFDEAAAIMKTEEYKTAQAALLEKIANMITDYEGKLKL